MHKGRLFGVTISIFLLLFSTFSLSVNAETNSSTIKISNQIVYVFGENENESIKLYKDPNTESEVLINIPDGAEVKLMDSNQDFSYVQFNDNESNSEYIGYIETKYIVDSSMKDQFLQMRKDQNGESQESTSLDSEDTENTADLPENNSKDVNEDDSSIPNQSLTNSVQDDTSLNDDKKVSPDNELTEQTNDKRLTLKSTVQDVQSQQKLQGIALKSPTNVYDQPSSNGKVIKSYQQGSLLYYKTYSSDWYQANVYINGVATTGYINKSDVDNLVSTQEKLSGIASKSPTNIYAKPSTSEKVIKTYQQGSLLHYKTYSSGWYEANVYINGVATTGYIHKNDVDNLVPTQEKSSGIASKSPTNIYAKPSTSGEVIKTYELGTLLYYTTYSSNWYQANVYINGVATTGYINKDDIDQIVQQKLRGIALKNPTNIYSDPSTNGKVIKSYNPGALLYYKTYKSGWYQANVYINGVATTGYINKNDVDNIVTTQTKKSGIAAKKPTNIYANPTTSGKVIKTYKQGTLLYYKTYSSSWYLANVYINGKATTGYIYKNDVDNLVPTQQKVQGITLKSPTNIYNKPSTSEKVIKTYQQGTLLYYKTYSSGWYQANVYINGKATTGYIYKNDVDNLVPTQEKVQGLALKSPTNVYNKPSRNGQVLKSYKKDSFLYLKTFTSGWYQVNVYINGKATTGYIHVDDISLDRVVISKYQNDLTLSEMVENQASKKPMTDLYRNKNAFVSKDYIKKLSTTKGQVTGTTSLNVREGPGTNYWIYGTLTSGDTVTIVSTQGAWYEITFDTWRYAKPDDIKKYIDPNLYKPKTPEYFQFLLLDKPAGLSATEVNSKILNNKGALTGTGSAFVNAAKKYSINEIYLISHSLLETGNGSSSLARGTVVNGKTVYNVFGYGAYDSCPVDCGAQFAYDQGWFTIEKAIEGAAKLIGEGYIHNGQNTLYKMRWYPPKPYHQYATDIGWAVKQTTNISRLYDLLDNYTLFFDVPEYK